MKNTLAENMLRFGVKNLSESDITKIEESIINEAFTDENGIIWPNCADQAAVDNVDAILEKMPLVTGLVAKTLFGGDGTTLNANNVIRYTGSNTIEFNIAICYSFIMNPNYSPSLSDYMSNIVKMMSSARGNVDRLVRTGSASFRWMDVFGTLYKSETQKWWDTEIEFKSTPTSQPERISRWNLYKRTYLNPVIKQLAPNLKKSTTATPANPQAPGTPQQ